MTGPDIAFVAMAGLAVWCVVLLLAVHAPWLLALGLLAAAFALTKRNART